MNAGKQIPVFGLAGTVTRDRIIQASGRRFFGWGGILYQAAVFSGLGQKVRLFSHVGKKELKLLSESFGSRPGLDLSGLQPVPGPSNRVRLCYPLQGERTEVLENAVPPLKAEKLLGRLEGFGLFMMVMNSGFDIDLEDWKKIVRKAACPFWLDIHSLVLTPVLGTPRFYRPFPAWKEWAAGIEVLQTNRKEAACMLGSPDKNPSVKDLTRLSREALETGVKTVFITLGTEGIWTAVDGRMEIVPPAPKKEAVDTTGCGDVFAAAAAVRLKNGDDPFSAAAFAVERAAGAAGVTGIEAVFDLFPSALHKIRGRDST